MKKRQRKLLDPLSGKRFAVVDQCALAARETAAATPVSDELDVFLQRRMTLNQEMDATASIMRSSPAVPAPGGIGAGVYFRRDTMGFRNSTAIYWRVVAPQFLGGTSTSLVYITASNQASHGPEALVSYRRNGEAVFRVWDWSSAPDANRSRFVVAIPFSQWGPYSATVQIDGGAHTTLYIANQTRRIRDTSWINEVFLFNETTQTFDTVWTHNFTWDPDSDPATKFFGWGPIIEPFAPFNFGTTARVGFADASLVTDGVSRSLTPTNSTIVQRRLGFEVAHLQPNHTLLAI
jgi:hypothetical protein